METEWFSHPEWWFAGGKYDDIICEKFEHLLDSADLTPIDKILVNDQLPRHIFRNQQAAHIIEFYLRKALQLDVDLDTLDDDRFCFALLPLRHSGSFDNIKHVLCLTWERINRQDSLVLRRFLRATYQRMPHLRAEHVHIASVVDDNILAFSTKEAPIAGQFVDKLPDTDKPIIVSLSGGVDSMVSSWMLLNKFKNVCALHINYNNRPTADKETDFVVDWCQRHNIPCFVRKISEIRREPCMNHGLREVYESYTRNVRYQCYKDFGNHAIVVLGHNRDDILENIFTNIAHKTKYENLDGMQEYSKQDGITFWRPLLNKSKDEIIKYAREHNIPYLPNSTPSWSQRGQIRADIVPVLEKWNPGFSESIHGLSHIIRDLYEVISDHINDILGTAVYEDNCVILKFNKLNKTEMFWKMMFNKLEISVSTKSLCNLVERLEKGNVKVEVSKNVQLVIKDKVCYIYSPHDE